MNQALIFLELKHQPQFHLIFTQIYLVVSWMNCC